MNLLVDIGNTRLKWAFCNQADIFSQAPLFNTDLNHNLLSQLWGNCERPSQLAVACVGPESIFELVHSVAETLWPKILIVKAQSQAYRIGVTNAYQQPEKLGVDRWLGLVAGFHDYQQSLCVVSCGTAITVDVIDKTGQHLGGLICPGLWLMKKALATQTEKLTFTETEFASGLANMTEAAIHNGVLTATSGLIETTLKNHPDIKLLLLTGGDAKKIAKHLSTPAIIAPDLVLRGLALTLI